MAVDKRFLWIQKSTGKVGVILTSKKRKETKDGKEVVVRYIADPRSEKVRFLIQELGLEPCLRRM